MKGFRLVKIYSGWLIVFVMGLAECWKKKKKPRIYIPVNMFGLIFMYIFTFFSLTFTTLSFSNFKRIFSTTMKVSTKCNSKS